MKYKELAEILNGFGLPTAYYAFSKETAKPAPYIVFYYDSRDDLFADNINYAHLENLVIELYTSKKDFELEERFESYLTEHEIAYAKSEVYLNDEKQFEIIYESEVVING